MPELGLHGRERRDAGARGSGLGAGVGCGRPGMVYEQLTSRRAPIKIPCSAG